MAKTKQYEPSEKLKRFLRKTVALEASLRDTYRMTQENKLRLAEISKYGFEYLKSHRAQVEKERKGKLAVIMKDYDRVCEMSAHKIYGDDYDLIKKYSQFPMKSIRRRRKD